MNRLWKKLLNDAFGVWNKVRGSYLRMKVKKDLNAKVDHEDKTFTVVVKKMQNLSAGAFALPIVNDCRRYY